MDFYDNYILLCNRAGKSPSAVALEIGLTKPTITRWKNGSTPTDATMHRVADYFAVPFDQLKYGEIGQAGMLSEFTEVVPEAAKKPAGQKTGELQSTGYYELTPEHQSIIDALIDSLLKSQSGQ